MNTENLKPTADMTDAVLKKMRRHRNYSWEEFWASVLALSPPPAKGTVAHWQWMDLRIKAKRRINRELRLRGRPERLKVIGQGKGVFVIDKTDVAPVTVEDAARRLVKAPDSFIVELDALAECPQLDPKDRRMARSMMDLLQNQKDATLLGISRLPSLPEAARRTIVKKLGFSPPKKRKGGGKS